jgi:TolB-like protein/DNA-binding winged helix-turn-helix (wHTH) protein/Flp pilus assembly protein TadD
MLGVSLSSSSADRDPMKYRVSDLTIDTGRQVVSRATDPIPLPKLSYDLLLVLVRAAPNLVSLDELMGLVWPGIVVSPETVSQRVKLLRDALDDDPRSPRYIAGLRGRGYQVVATVEEIGGDRAAGSATASDKPLAPHPELWRNRIPLAVVFAVVVVALGWFLAAKFWMPHRHAQEKAAVVAPAFPAISESSIAVLPFVDMSEKKDQEYFSDGLSEELIELLGKTPGLRVIARTSSFYFKGRAEKLDAIAAELHVANVLEGSVRKSGDRLRVTAQLIRADTSDHLWSETFDRDLRDVFKVQDEIASAVVTALKIRLLPMEPLAAQSELHTENLEAYNLYLQGRQSYNQADAAGYQRAVTAFRAATALDSHYAVAYAALALARFWLADPTNDIPGYESALAAAEKAVTLAPELAAGYSARGFIRGIYRFDFAGAQADLDKAVALNPSDATVLHRSAVLLAVFGKLPEAIAREEKALALDPLSEEICRRLGVFLVANQQLAQARPLYEKALVIAPSSWHARFNLGDLELLENRPEQALSEFQQTEDPSSRLAGEAKAEYSLGHLDASRRALDELIADYGKTDMADWAVAKVYAWRGEKDKAFEWLERAYVHKDTGFTSLKIDPDFRGLRSDARFTALLNKMNLPAP